MNTVKCCLLLTIVSFFIFCSETKTEKTQNLQETNISENKTTPLFSIIPSEQSGVNFTNYNKENNDYNYYAYEYFYNGGGVATADFNNDGLLDIVFTANMAPNKLYINKGNFTFQDVTQKANINSNEQDWCTGITIVDINNDGYQDIFISRSGWFENDQEEKLSNLLFVNNKDLTFTEQSKEYGFTDMSRSTQACFFDIDNDGDLDMYLINNPKEHTKTREYKDGTIKLVDVGSTYQDSDKLYINTNGKYTDITKKAGLVNADYGLGVVAADLNNDGYQDLYIANDYSKPDAILLNQKNGTFKNTTNTSLKHMSKFSMGVDIADINNDGLLDIFNSEMLGKDNYSKKVNMASMNPKLYWGFVNSGYHYQDMHNSLQLNNGNDTFSEIAWMSNVAETDWSWCPLIADFDNDGNKDIFVTNGIKREVFNKDFMGKQGKGLTENPKLFESAIDFLPAKKSFNAMFKNNGDLTFTDSAMDWGLKTQAFNSNGAAYADFDNDGDLDLVINNIEDPAAIYKNNASQSNNSITLTITKSGAIPYGAKATILKGDTEQVSQITNTRGFQSVSDHRLHFGLANATKVDSILVTWPNNKKSIYTNLAANKNHAVKYEEASFTSYTKKQTALLFKDVTNKMGITAKHQEIEFDDYKTEILLPQKQSQEGPFVSVADVNGDGLDDFFQGNGAGYAGTLYIQTQNGTFKKGNQKAFIEDKASEDIGLTFFDYDADGDQDLYVVSGSNEHTLTSSQMQDRLYTNDGSGNFSKTTNSIPKDNASGSCVIAKDIDGDGDLDLFVGGYQTPQQYPKAGKSLLLINENGVFTNQIATLAPELETIGMVKDAALEDINNDGKIDIVVVGHWMPVTIFESTGTTFTNTTAKYGISDKIGWWNSIEITDLDSNGTKDFIVGNLGLNSKHKSNLGQPFKIMAKDFDNNGTNDIALGYYNNNSLYPVRGLQCSAEQNPDLKQSIRSFSEFGNLTFDEVYSKYDLSDAIKLEATYFQSAAFYNEGASFTIKALPNENQMAPTNGILSLNIKGKQSLVTIGNLYPVEVETGRYDAHKGTVLTSKEKIVTVKTNSGFFNDKDARDICMIIIKGKKHIMVANNRDQLTFFEVLD
jgi:hypothetical protein